jgi:hypothetical protein
MNDTRQSPPTVDRTYPHGAVPDSQARALDRRHSLDQQQRAFQAPSSPMPYLLRRRPPA